MRPVSDLLKQLDGGGHAVFFRECRSPMFGTTWQPVCIDCDYVGPHTPEARAHAIGDEHRQKSAGVWKPAR